jgi:hypothetical protein
MPYLSPQLMRLEQLRHDVLNMDAKAYAEIKHYANPPEQVIAILQACLVLVGEDERKLGVSCQGKS